MVLRIAAEALVRLPLNDDVLGAFRVLLHHGEEVLHRDSLGHARRLKLAKLSQGAHPAKIVVAGHDS